MLYKDLNLKQIRDENKIDFAHFTFLKGMCSCCYGPKDFPKKYWRNGKIATDNNYTYLLFKNAENGSGTVTRNDTIENVYVCWEFPEEKLKKVCDDLQQQLGSDYTVEIPTNKYECIKIVKLD